MEWEAGRFARSLEPEDPATTVDPLQLTAQLEGRFRLLWGIYRAHSEVGFMLAEASSASCLLDYSVPTREGRRGCPPPPHPWGGVQQSCVF